MEAGAVHRVYCKICARAADSQTNDGGLGLVANDRITEAELTVIVRPPALCLSVVNGTCI